MILQLRTYTINEGMMDSFIDIFTKHIKPLHARLNIPVQGMWTNIEKNEFIWMRKFESIDEIPAKERAFSDSPERKSLGDRPTSHIAKMDIKIIESLDIN
ncbi:MAG TPA: hypothetical protein DEZ08_04400 [Dehalococcoidia bacterium]|jgi:hypothetical protein|nr:hypothetical protein [Dehalococcoidia bacterium]|tara:strand:+ start:926 stop:1225 length:300 start_codon:yes stop_codon:yes gene_type:complete